MDSVDPVTSEDFVGAGFEDSSGAVEVAVALHASQGDGGLPGASLRRKAKGLERDFQVRGDPTDGLGGLDADPDHVPSRQTRERPGSSNSDWERWMSAHASRIAVTISGTRPSSVSPRNFTVR